MIHLEGDDSGFSCPHCAKKWWVDDWDTEYNQAIMGTSTVRCPECEKEFNIDVSLQITSFA